MYKFGHICKIGKASNLSREFIDKSQIYGRKAIAKVIFKDLFGNQGTDWSMDRINCDL